MTSRHGARCGRYTPEDVAIQTANTLATIAWALGEAGFALADVVRIRTIVTDRAHIPAVYEVLGRPWTRSDQLHRIGLNFNT